MLNQFRYQYKQNIDNIIPERDASLRAKLLACLQTFIFRNEGVAQQLLTTQTLIRILAQDAPNEILKLLRSRRIFGEGHVVSDLPLRIHLQFGRVSPPSWCWRGCLRKTTRRPGSLWPIGRFPGCTSGPSAVPARHTAEFRTWLPAVNFCPYGPTNPNRISWHFPTSWCMLTWETTTFSGLMSLCRTLMPWR